MIFFLLTAKCELHIALYDMWFAGFSPGQASSPGQIFVSMGKALNLNCPSLFINGDLRVTYKYSCVHRFEAVPYGKSPRGHIDVVHCSAAGTTV